MNACRRTATLASESDDDDDDGVADLAVGGDDSGRERVVARLGAGVAGASAAAPRFAALPATKRNLSKDAIISVKDARRAMTCRRHTARDELTVVESREKARGNIFGQVSIKGRDGRSEKKAPL